MLQNTTVPQLLTRFGGEDLQSVLFLFPGATVVQFVRRSFQREMAILESEVICAVCPSLFPEEKLPQILLCIMREGLE